MMRFCMHCSAGLIAVVMPVAGNAITVEEIFDRMQATELAGLQEVESVLLNTETMGMSQVEYYEKTSRVDVNGRTMYILRNVPPSEIAERHSGGNAMSDASPEALRRAAEVIESQGPEMERGMRDEMRQSGLPAGLGEMLMTAPPDEPWLSANPNDMTQMYGMMLRGAAEGKEDQARRDASAVDSAHERAQIANRTRLVGQTNLDGRPAFHLLAANVNHRQVEDGVEIIIRDVNMFVDAERFVPLAMQMEGTMREGGETREITIKRQDQDYRRVPGCGTLYRPFKSVMRMAGVMNAEQQAQMREAQAQLAQLDEQMAEMPAGQRDMIMRQMGPQMDMMRNMAAGGGIEIASTVRNMQCNVPAPDPVAVAQGLFGGGTPESSGSAYQLPRPAAGKAQQAAPGGMPESANRQAGRQACLEEKIAAAEAAQETKRGLGKLMSAAGRVASRFGNEDVAQSTRDAHTAGATADDLAGAARDLGLTEDEIAECDKP